MPTLNENKTVWDGTYNWSKAGEEWSDLWGSSAMQWYGTILPRIRSFLPAQTILEIAPGFGRWTEYLKDSCDNLIAVDISEKCINACRKRFVGCTQMTFFVNDGSSLDMIPDNTIDFIFSFDSLVHVEDTVISAYVNQFSRKLKKNGVAFIHHSNLGDYGNYVKMQLRLTKYPKLLANLIKLGILENVRNQWRDRSMAAEKMRAYAEANGLQCIGQELLTWSTKRILIDCISMITKRNSVWARDNQVFKNAFFMCEAKNIFNLSRLYDLRPEK